MNAVTHLEKVIVGEVSAVTHLEKVIAGETSAVTYTEKVITGEATPITHLQKVIAGEASPVTHLEYVWAGSTPSPTEPEYTGAVPYTFTADGSPLISWRISGNTVQNGTPTPDNPIMPQGTGERTGNLFDKSTAVGGYGVDNNSGNLFRSAVLSASDYINISGESYIRATYITSGVTNQYGAFYDNNKTYISGYSNYSNAIAVPQNAVYTRITARTEYIDEFMLNTGSQPLPYEPYGIKIPISSANTTTPVYLGEVETTRKIKKLVLKGSVDENITLYTIATGNLFRIELPSLRLLAQFAGTGFCTHYRSVYRSVDRVNGTISGGNVAAVLGVVDIVDNYATVEDFKTYLAQQYSAGTPVTVWYVLATEETGIVNEPLMKIGDYADEVANVATIPTNNGSNTFDVDTAVKPSEVYIKWKGV